MRHFLNSLSCVLLLAATSLYEVQAQPVFEEACKTISNASASNKEAKSFRRQFNKQLKSNAQILREMKGCLPKKRLKKLRQRLNSEARTLREQLTSVASSTQVCATSTCYELKPKQLQSSITRSTRRYLKRLRAVNKTASSKCGLSSNSESDFAELLEQASFNKRRTVCLSPAEAVGFKVPKRVSPLYGPEDEDQDGLGSAAEFVLDLNPSVADSDGDGVIDGDEDNDADGIKNSQEVASRTNALSASSPVADGELDNDGDTLTAAFELVSALDDSNADTDGDGTSDKVDFFGVAATETAEYSLSGAAPSGSPVSVSIADGSGAAITADTIASEQGLWTVTLNVESLSEGALSAEVSIGSPGSGAAPFSYQLALTSLSSNTLTADELIVRSVEALPVSDFTEQFLSRAEPFIPTSIELNDGRLVRVSSRTPDLSAERVNEVDGSREVFLYLYNSSGELISEQTVAEDPLLNQSEPHIALLDNGNFVVTWTAPDAGGNGVFARLYGPDATSLGGSFRVNSVEEGNQAQSWVSPGQSGQFVVSWTTSRFGSPEMELKVFNANGTPLSADILATDTTDGLKANTGRVVLLPNGDFVISSRDDTNNLLRAHIRVIGADGVPVTDIIQVGDDTASVNIENILAFSNGNFGLVVNEETGDQARVGGAGPSDFRAVTFYLYDGNGNLLVDSTPTHGYPLGLQLPNESLLSKGIAESHAVYFRQFFPDESASRPYRVFINQDGEQTEQQATLSDEVPLQVSSEAGREVTFAGTLSGTGEVKLTMNGTVLARSLTDEQGEFSVVLEDFVMNALPPIGTLSIQTSDGAGNSKELTATQLAVFSEGDSTEEVIHRAAPSIREGERELINGLLPTGGESFVSLFSTSSVNNAGQNDMFLQRSSAPGEILGDPIPVTQNPDAIQAFGSIAPLTNDNFIVSWRSNHTGSNAVYYRTFSSDGTPLIDDTEVTTVGNQNVMCSFPDGGWLIAWTQTNDVRYQRWDASGTPLVMTTLINTTTPNFQGLPTVSCADDGSALIAWQSHGQELDGSKGVFYRIIDAMGTPTIGETQAATLTANDQVSPRAATDGTTHLLSWIVEATDAESQRFARRFASNGGAVDLEEFEVPLGSETTDRFRFDLLLGSDGAMYFFRSEKVDLPQLTDVMMSKFDVDTNLLIESQTIHNFTFQEQTFVSAAFTESGQIISTVGHSLLNGMRGDSLVGVLDVTGQLVNPDYERITP